MVKREGMGADRWKQLKKFLNVIPKRLVWLNCSVKAFENLNEVEEKLEEEDQAKVNGEIATVTKVFQDYKKLAANNVFEIVEINGDRKHAQVLANLDRIWEVDVMLLRNFSNQILKMEPILFANQARGYDLLEVPENLLAKRCEEIKKEINLLRIQRGLTLVCIINPQV